MVIRKTTGDYDNSNNFSKHDKSTFSNTCSCCLCLSVFVTNRVTSSALFFLACWVTFNFFLPFEYTKWLGIYFDVIQGLLLFSMQKNSTRSGLFKRYLSVILNLQVFEVVRIALQNIKTDGSRFLCLRNKNNKPSDVFSTSAMQRSPQTLLPGDTSGFTLRMSS